MTPIDARGSTRFATSFMAIWPRAVSLGAITGAVIAAIPATADFPFVGTFFGAIAGAVIGATLGLLFTFFLAGPLPAGWSTGWASAACAAATALCLIADPAVTAPYWSVPHAHLLSVVTCAVIGAALAPVARYGAKPITVRGRPRTWADLTRAALRSGAVAGAIVGMIVGLVIGLRAYPPTCAFAAVEGGLFGAATGALVAVALGLATIAPRLRLRR